MIRIDRVLKDSLSDRALALIPHLEAIGSSLGLALGQSFASLFATAKEDGEYINFFAKSSGNISYTDYEELKNTNSSLFELLEQKCSGIKDYLHSALCTDPLLNEHKENIIYFLDNIPKLALIEGQQVLIVIAQSKEQAAAIGAAPAAASAVAGGAAAATSHTLCYILTALFALLLFLGVLWWLFLRPWPLSGDCASFFADLPPKLDYISEHEQQKLDELNARLLDADTKSSQKDDEIARLNEELLKKEQEAKNNQEDRLKHDEMLKSKDEQIQKLKDDIKKLESQTKAQKVKVTDPAMASKPKCSDLKKSNKYPRLVIAFDGSESMLSNDIDYTTAHNRINLAKKAVSDMVPLIDKRVSIGLVEINGCPLAKNHGFFASDARSALISKVRAISPYSYDGKTPLSSGILNIANSVDGVESDDVGILISDGEDTCFGAEVCSLADSIHKAKPRLKIHVLSIAQDISNVKCVADITGGKILEPQSVSDFTQQLNNLSSELNQGRICKD